MWTIVIRLIAKQADCFVNIFIQLSFITYDKSTKTQKIQVFRLVHDALALVESNCWFSFVSAFQLFLAVESSSLFHLCIRLIFMFSGCCTDEQGTLHAD